MRSCVLFCLMYIALKFIKLIRANHYTKEQNTYIIMAGQTKLHENVIKTMHIKKKDILPRIHYSTVY